MPYGKVDRNKAIQDLHNLNKEYYSFGRLAAIFGIKRQNIYRNYWREQKRPKKSKRKKA